ncbi:hypothetical protein [Roseiconus lacunae]|uniref:hypothetical protein n=1 Tax=Roseiconus lacunae TaxID=2605694 RepID=UPI001E3ACC86|nr:hypothetical protein [Roseiconus lacunae]MCD0460154.1 hypothetical protein [Roseiconus lacunae]
MSDNLNPYIPSTDNIDHSPYPREPSTWRRNFGMLCAVVFTYSSISAVFAALQQSLPPSIVYPLILAAVCCSTWANFQLGPRIGWTQGGLPIMFVLVFGWAVVYVLASLTGAGVVYWVFDPDRLLH